jgi:FtsP/CotA-like multicopper oxidase with cupredoxin domain
MAAPSLHFTPYGLGSSPGPSRTGTPPVPGRADPRAELPVHVDGFKGKYVFHCQNLEHEDMQTMGNLRVT